MMRYSSGVHKHSISVTNLTQLSESCKRAIATHAVKDIKSKLMVHLFYCKQCSCRAEQLQRVLYTNQEVQHKRTDTSWIPL